jgi:two-component system phosphate regulon response regulator PhoB
MHLGDATLGKSMQKKILIVDDEAPIREMVALILRRSGFTVLQAATEQQTYEQLLHHPDLILMDWMLTDCSGIDIAKKLRRSEINQEIPIIMLTARAEEDDKVRALEYAVDDYIVKPFSPRELTARIQAVLRRSSPDLTGKILQLGTLSIDTAKHMIKVNQSIIKLSPIEYRLLYFFATHRDRIYSREQIIDQVWGQQSYIDERTVDVQIRRLRKALSTTGHGNLIQTVRSVGYILSTPTNSSS